MSWPICASTKLLTDFGYKKSVTDSSLFILDNSNDNVNSPFSFVPQQIMKNENPLHIQYPNIIYNTLNIGVERL